MELLMRKKELCEKWTPKKDWNGQFSLMREDANQYVESMKLTLLNGVIDKEERALSDLKSKEGLKWTVLINERG